MSCLAVTLLDLTVFSFTTMCRSHCGHFLQGSHLGPQKHEHMNVQQGGTKVRTPPGKLNIRNQLLGSRRLLHQYTPLIRGLRPATSH